MSLFDLASKIAVMQSLAPAAMTDDQAGVAVNTGGFDSVAIEYIAGAWTDGSFTGSLLECDTVDGEYTAVAASDIHGTLPTVASGDGDNKCYWVGYKGNKQFLKAGWNQTASPPPGTGMVGGASVILGTPRRSPTQ